MEIYIGLFIIIAWFAYSIIMRIINTNYKLEQAKIDKGIISDVTENEAPVIYEDKDRNSFKNIFCMALMGVGVSALISLGFSIGFNNFLPAAPSAVKQWGMIGAAVANYSSGAIFFIGAFLLGNIFAITSWSISQRTLVHFLFLYGVFLLSSFLGHWFGVLTVINVLINSAVFTGIYFFIWSMYRIHYKKQACAMNQKIEKMQKD